MIKKKALQESYNKWTEEVGGAIKQVKKTVRKNPRKDNQSQRKSVLRQLYKTQLIRVFPQKPKDSSIKTRSPSPISMLWVSNLSAAWSGRNLQTHQHSSKAVRENFCKK